MLQLHHTQRQCHCNPLRLHERHKRQLKFQLVIAKGTKVQKARVPPNRSPGLAVLDCLPQLNAVCHSVAGTTSAAHESIANSTNAAEDNTTACVAWPVIRSVNGYVAGTGSVCSCSKIECGRIGQSRAEGTQLYRAPPEEQKVTLGKLNLASSMNRQKENVMVWDPTPTTAFTATLKNFTPGGASQAGNNAPPLNQPLLADLK